MENFFSLLKRRTQDVSSLLCVGLDPHLSDLPSPTAEAALDFCLHIVKETAPYAAAYKPNAAFFEMFGAEGWSALKELITTITSNSFNAGSRIPVILDAKRGDIFSTAEAYAKSAFEILGADCITLSPYLGKDSIDPFITDHEKGVFILCKTSNPSAADLQDLPLGKSGMATLHEYVAHLAQSWNTKGNIGLVVGATQLDALRRVRAAAPDLWFLAPGVGAQGADLGAALRAGLRADGMGMLLPVSRGISRAENPRRAAAELRDEIAYIQSSLSRKQQSSSARPSKPAFRYPALADALLELGCVRFGEFTLKSGLVSPIYVDLRRLIADPSTLELVAEAFIPLLQTLAFDHLAALPYAAMPITTAISLQGGWPMIYPRKEVKAYGTKAQIEGVFEAGQRTVVIDDLITTGGSKLEGIEKLAGAGLQVSDVVVLINRQSGGADFMAEHGYRLHAVFTLPELLDYWEAAGKVGTAQITRTRAFLADQK